MTRWTRSLIVASAVAGIAVLGMPSADAAPLTFQGAGYLLSGPDQMTMTFRVPTVTCDAGESFDLDIGAFSSRTSYEWKAIAELACNSGFFESYLVVEVNGFGVGRVLNAPGDLVQVVLSGLHATDPSVLIRDRDVLHSGLRADIGTGGGDIAVGALADPAPQFPTFTERVSVDNGLPMLKVPHTHQDEVRGGVTAIKLGTASAQGYRFPLMYKHS